MHKFPRIIFIFSLNGSTCFGVSLVHHQEQHLISCTVQLVHAGTSGCYMDIGRTISFLYPYSSQMYRHECTNCTVQLIKCSSWWWTNDSPKHVQQFNEKIKIIHNNLCISLVYTHIPSQLSYWNHVSPPSSLWISFYSLQQGWKSKVFKIGPMLTLLKDNWTKFRTANYRLIPWESKIFMAKDHTRNYGFVRRPQVEK